MWRSDSGSHTPHDDEIVHIYSAVCIEVGSETVGESGVRIIEQPFLQDDDSLNIIAEIILTCRYAHSVLNIALTADKMSGDFFINIS